MKKTLLAVILAACTSSAIAAPTAVLKVKGVLTNAACSPTLSNSGVVDYGTVHLSDLSDSAVNQLGQKTIDLTITCDAATKVSGTWSMTEWTAVLASLLITAMPPVVPFPPPTRPMASARQLATWRLVTTPCLLRSVAL